MSDVLDDGDVRDVTERDENEEGASLIGGGGPPSTLNEDAEMDEADFHGDRLAGGDPTDRPGNGD